MSATKDQERTALEKIWQIVTGLGPDSYIGMAFTGVWEIAEENIDNDFGQSARERWELAREEAEKQKVRADEAEQRAEKAERNAKTYLDGYGVVSDEKEALIQRLSEIERENSDFAGQIKACENQILVLKARLYDYMIQSA